MPAPTRPATAVFTDGTDPLPPTAAEAAIARRMNTAADTDRLITVAHLRALLAEEPDDAVVIVAKDREGNGYSPLVGVRAAWYAPDSSYSGEVYDFDPPAGDEPYEPERGTDLYALVLDPTN